MNPETSKLITEAKKAALNAQAKFSNFPVGAALLSKNNVIYHGCNVECSSYGLSICAERVALTKALSEGDTSFKSITIFAPKADYCPPCGACRQLLYDYAPNITVILTNGKDNKSFTLKELLPEAFDQSQLK